MCSRRLFFCVVAVSAAFAAHAQTIYKTIGPDGKPVYSDKPPANPAAKYSVIGPKPSAPAQAEPAPAQAGQPKPAQPSTVDPDLENAVIAVMAADDLVRRYGEVCSRAAPASAVHLKEAIETWRKRNGRIVAQQQRILSEAFTPAERAAAEAVVKAKNQRVLDSLSRASEKEKPAWCNESLAEISNGSLDVYAKRDVSGPLAKFRQKQQE
jgi:hypothetical protein